MVETTQAEMAAVVAALGRIEAEMRQVRDDVREVKDGQRALDRTVRGWNGSDGLVSRIKTVEQATRDLLQKFEAQVTQRWSFTGAVVTAAITATGLVLVAIITAVVGPLLLRGYQAIVP